MTYDKAMHIHGYLKTDTMIRKNKILIHRPDVVLYLETLRRVIMIELTSGNEENFEDQRPRKLTATG